MVNTSIPKAAIARKSRAKVAPTVETEKEKQSLTIKQQLVVLRDEFNFETSELPPEKAAVKHQRQIIRDDVISSVDVWSTVGRFADVGFMETEDGRLGVFVTPQGNGKWKHKNGSYEVYPFDFIEQGDIVGLVMEIMFAKSHDEVAAAVNAYKEFGCESREAEAA